MCEKPADKPCAIGNDRKRNHGVIQVAAPHDREAKEHVDGTYYQALNLNIAIVDVDNVSDDLFAEINGLFTKGARCLLSLSRFRRHRVAPVLCL